jgi:hypothetical protein
MKIPLLRGGAKGREVAGVCLTKRLTRFTQPLNLPSLPQAEKRAKSSILPPSISRSEREGRPAKRSRGESTKRYLKNIITNVPAIISDAATIVLAVSGSPKNIAAKTIAIATLNLSTGATCDTSPNCRALK